MIARHATAGQLEVIVRAYRGVLGYELGRATPPAGGASCAWITTTTARC